MSSSEQQLICEGIVWVSYSVCEGVSILEMIPVLCLRLAGVRAGVVCFLRVPCLGFDGRDSGWNRGTFSKSKSKSKSE